MKKLLIITVLLMSLSSFGQSLKESSTNVKVNSIDALIGLWADINPRHIHKTDYTDSNILRIDKDGHFRFTDWNYNTGNYHVLTGDILISKSKIIFLNFNDRPSRKIEILVDLLNRKENLSRYVLVSDSDHDFIKVR